MIQIGSSDPMGSTERIKWKEKKKRKEKRGKKRRKRKKEKKKKENKREMDWMWIGGLILDEMNKLEGFRNPGY